MLIINKIRASERPLQIMCQKDFLEKSHSQSERKEKILKY